jgi:hypothetical protein
MAGVPSVTIITRVFRHPRDVQLWGGQFQTILRPVLGGWTLDCRLEAFAAASSLLLAWRLYKLGKQQFEIASSGIARRTFSASGRRFPEYTERKVFQVFA